MRDDGFAGETLHTIAEARELAQRWCRQEYGLRRHARTRRLPLECFEAEEQPLLLPAPALPCEVPYWCDPKVGRDHLAQVAKALYSLPTRFIGKRLRARADRALVRFYDQGMLVKTHPRQSAGGRSIDANDFPAFKSAYAMRDCRRSPRVRVRNAPGRSARLDRRAQQESAQRQTCGGVRP